MQHESSAPSQLTHSFLLCERCVCFASLCLLPVILWMLTRQEERVLLCCFMSERLAASAHDALTHPCALSLFLSLSSPCLFLSPHPLLHFVRCIIDGCCCFIDDCTCECVLCVCAALRVCMYNIICVCAHVHTHSPSFLPTSHTHSHAHALMKQPSHCFCFCCDQGFSMRYVRLWA